jgi:hypothetical protein
MRSCFGGRVSVTKSSFSFRGRRYVRFVVRLRRRDGSILTTIIRQWRYGVSSASTATASSDRAGTQPR